MIAKLILVEELRQRCQVFCMRKGHIFVNVILFPAFFLFQMNSLLKAERTFPGCVSRAFLIFAILPLFHIQQEGLVPPNYLILIRLPKQNASGQGSHTCVTRRSEMFVNFILNTFTLLAFTQSVDNLFHSFIVLCENEYFLMSNQH